MPLPQVALGLLKRGEDPDQRERYLLTLVSVLARTDLGQAKKLIADIRSPSRHAQASASVAAASNADFQQTTELLQNSLRAEWWFGDLDLANHWTNALRPFARERPADTADVVAQHLSTVPAAYTLRSLGRELLKRDDSPSKEAGVLLESAMNIARESGDAELICRRISGGHGKLYPDRALEVFDTELLPQLKRHDTHQPHRCALRALH